MNTIVVNRDNTTLVVQQAVNPVMVDRTANGTIGVVTAGPQGRRGEDGRPGADAAGQIPPVAFSWGDAPAAVFTAERAGVLTTVRIQFTTAFNGVGAQVRVDAATEVAMPPEYNDPYSVLEYENTPDTALAEGDTVSLTVTPGTASQGAGLLFLTFLPTE